MNKLTGGSSDYYKVNVDMPTSGGEAYMVECNDIIEALAWRNHRTLAIHGADKISRH